MKKIFYLILLSIFLTSNAFAANKLISDLTADTSPTSDDLIETQDAPGGSTSSKKVTMSDLKTLMTAGVGTVSSASVVTTNGFSGSVANSTTAPAITLTTTVTGILKGNGTSVSAATSGSDYAPATSGSSLLKGNGSGGFSNASSGTDYAPATSGSSILYGNGSGGFSNVSIGSNLTFVGGTLSASGGGGGSTPGGSIYTVQYNNAGSLGGIANTTTDGTTLTTSSPTVTGHATIEGVTATGATGTGRFVFDNTPTLVTPNIGAATGTSLALSGAIGQLGGSTGNSLSGSTGVLTLAGIGNTNNEDLKIDLEGTANTAVITSSTGVTRITSSAIGLGLGKADHYFGPSATANSQIGIQYINSGGSTTGTLTAISGNYTNSNSNATAGVIGVTGNAIRAGTTGGNSGTLIGVKGVAQYSSTGTQTDAFGVYGQAQKITSASGSITDAYSVYGDAPVASGGGSITNSWAGGFNGAVKLGTAGSTVGSLVFNNVTSGTITVQPTTGALGTRTLTLPAETGTVCTTGSVCSGYSSATSGSSLLYGNNAGGTSNVTVGSGLSFSGGTLSASGGGFSPIPTTVVTGTTQSASVNNAYVSNNASAVTITLPSSASVGDEVQVSGLGAGGWVIAQNASQLVHVGSVATTTGTGGSITSTNRYDSITLKCVVANTTWVVVGSQGIFTII